MSVNVAEVERLRRLTWAALDREALEAGVPLYKIRAAKTRDALRLLILTAKSGAAPSGRIERRPLET